MGFWDKIWGGKELVSPSQVESKEKTKLEFFVEEIDEKLSELGGHRTGQGNEVRVIPIYVPLHKGA